MGRGGQPPALQELIHFRLRGNGSVFPRANTVHQHAQWPGCGLLRILLSQRTTGRITGVSKDLLPCLSQFHIQFSECFYGKEDFSAHFNQRRVPCAGKFGRDRLDGQHIGCDIFTNNAITTCGCRDELPVFVTQIDGEAINLQFAEIVDLTPGVFLDAGCPVHELFFREDIVQAHHACCVSDRSKEFGGLAPNRERGAVLALKFWIEALELFQALYQCVVFEVGNETLIAFVIGITGVKDFGREGFSFVLCFLEVA